MRLGYRLLLLALSVFASTQARASVFLTLAADPSGSECYVADPGPNGLAYVYVILDYEPPLSGATGVSFAAPVPVGSGLTYAGETTSFSTIGNSQTGVDVQFGACLYPSTPIVVMTMIFVRTSGGNPCTRYGPASAPVFIPLIYDCQYAQGPMSVRDVILNWDGSCDQLAHPSPLDGASDVPLITSLDWRGPVECTPMLRGDPFVRFGTSVDPPLYALSGPPISVGPLAPMTTYYWNVDGGPLWSFTTTDKVATEQSTWGRIKTLYR